MMNDYVMLGEDEFTQEGLNWLVRVYLINGSEWALIIRK
jgi:hypothetical protein